MAATGVFTFNDFKEFSTIYACEFNRPEMHDRLLVLDVFDDHTEDEINTKTRDMKVMKHRKRHLNDEDERYSTKATKKKRSVPNLKASFSFAGKGKPSSAKKKANSKRVITLRSRKVSKTATDHESQRKYKVEDGTSLEKQETIGQHKIFAHSSWMSVHSNYFRALFYSGLKESHLKEVHFKIPKTEEAAHLHLIEAMYNLDVLNNLPVSELIQILVLADKYDAKFVFRKCKYVLKTKVESIKIAEEIYNVIKVENPMVNVEDLIDTIENFLINKFQPLDQKWESSSFENLSEPFLTLLLSSSKLIVSCEDVVFHALMHWMKNNAIFAKKVASKNVLKLQPELLSGSHLLSLVRFELLTISYLHTVVHSHPIAKQMANFNEYFLKGIYYRTIPREVLDSKVIDINAPEKRSPHIADIVQFQWEMPDKEVLKVLTTLHSQVFWACGYKMQLSLCQQFNLGDKFFVKITLKIVSLKEGGFTFIDWDIHYNGASIFPEEDFHGEDYILTHDRPEEVADGSFDWVGSGSCILKFLAWPCQTSININ